MGSSFSNITAVVESYSGSRSGRNAENNFKIGSIPRKFFQQLIQEMERTNGLTLPSQRFERNPPVPINV